MMNRKLFLPLGITAILSSLIWGCSNSRNVHDNNTISEPVKSPTVQAVSNCPYNINFVIQELQSADSLFQLAVKIEETKIVYNNYQCQEQKSSLRGYLIDAEMKMANIIFQKKYLYCASRLDTSTISSCQDTAQREYDQKINEINSRY